MKYLEEDSWVLKAISNRAELKGFFSIPQGGGGQMEGLSLH